MPLQLAHPAPRAQPPTRSQESTVTRRATGTFDVELTPQPVHAEAEGILGRMSIDKRFRGDLLGTSHGEMMAASTSVPGSAGYVAIERVTAALEGRTGTFVLQHSGIMNRGEPTLSIRVVPDSGTGELEGITGTLDILIEGGVHSYVLEYSLPERA